jgi:hypothetical protein
VRKKKKDTCNLLMLALLFYVFEEARDTITGPMEEAYREFVTSEPTSLFFWGVKSAFLSVSSGENCEKLAHHSKIKESEQ